MVYSKAMSQYNKHKIERLRMRLKAIEASEDYKLYLAYAHLSPIEKDQLLSRWNSYFTRVRETTAYNRYQVAGAAFRKKDLATVKQFKEDAHNQVLNDDMQLTKPPLADPMYLNQLSCVMEYRQIINTINNSQNNSSTDADQMEEERVMQYIK